MEKTPCLPNPTADASADRLGLVRAFHYGRGASDHGPVEGRAAVLSAFDPESTIEEPDATEPLRALLAIARNVVPERRQSFAREVARLREGLVALLALEDGRDPSADQLQRSIGSVGSNLLDASALARVLGPQRGSLRVDPRRRQRIERAIAVFDEHRTFAETPLLTVLHGPEDRGSVPDEPELLAIEAGDPCGEGVARFDAEAGRVCEWIRAVRTARLEIAAAYDPERHDTWLETLDWEGLTADELALVPTIVCLESATDLGDERMPSLSRLLRSGRPVHVVAIAFPLRDPAQTADTLFSSYHVELAYLGVGHREAFVQQTCTARREHMDAGFTRALGGTRSALHVVAVESSDAAILSRAHPLFRYDPDAGGSLARRLDFTGNPEPEADWPQARLACTGSNGAARELVLPFTFVDYALRDPALAGEFLPLSDAFRSADLVPIADFLELDVAKAARQLPYVWVIDAERDLHRLVVSRRLVYACRDRLAFWRSLQELAGIHNEFVEQALEQARQEVRQHRAELDEQRAAELERVRSEAVGQAMQQLAANLVGLGPGEFASVALAPAAPSTPLQHNGDPVDTAAVEAAAPDSPEDDQPVSAEPWIETPLCTSCNDCRDLNPRLFVYDENKQATIGDVRAGTYAQLVKAAEKCPARCIHPGLPLDPNEPGVKALLARAEPFNR